MTLCLLVGWFKGHNIRESHISWENLWFPVDSPVSQPIDIYFPMKTRSLYLLLLPMSIVIGIYWWCPSGLKSAQLMRSYPVLLWDDIVDIDISTNFMEVTKDMMTGCAPSWKEYVKKGESICRMRDVPLPP